MYRHTRTQRRAHPALHFHVRVSLFAQKAVEVRVHHISRRAPDVELTLEFDVTVVFQLVANNHPADDIDFIVHGDRFTTTRILRRRVHSKRTLVRRVFVDNLEG